MFQDNVMLTMKHDKKAQVGKDQNITPTMGMFNLHNYRNVNVRMFINFGASKDPDLEDTVNLRVCNPK